MKDLIHQFRDFVAKKAAEGGTFNYWNPTSCALAQFGQSIGYPEAYGGSEGFSFTRDGGGWTGQGRGTKVLLDTTIPSLLTSVLGPESYYNIKWTTARWSDLLTALDRHLSIPADYRVVTKEAVDAL